MLFILLQIIYEMRHSLNNSYSTLLALNLHQNQTAKKQEQYPVLMHSWYGMSCQMIFILPPVSLHIETNLSLTSFFNFIQQRLFINTVAPWWSLFSNPWIFEN